MGLGFTLYSHAGVSGGCRPGRCCPDPSEVDERDTPRSLDPAGLAAHRQPWGRTPTGDARGNSCSGARRGSWVLRSCCSARAATSRSPLVHGCFPAAGWNRVMPRTRRTITPTHLVSRLRAGLPCGRPLKKRASSSMLTICNLLHTGPGTRSAQTVFNLDPVWPRRAVHPGADRRRGDRRPSVDRTDTGARRTPLRRDRHDATHLDDIAHVVEVRELRRGCRGPGCGAGGEICQQGRG